MNINPLRYKTYYYDIESGMYYLNNRYYNPMLFRFITLDSYEYIEITNVDSYNLYTYCYNNPVMYSDPEGNYGILTVLFVGALIGAAVGGVGQASADILSNIWRHGFNFSEWTMSSWQTYVGAVVGGAIGGALTPFLGPVSTATINGSLSSLVGM